MTNFTKTNLFSCPIYKIRIDPNSYDKEKLILEASDKVEVNDSKNNILVRFDAKYLTPQNFQILVNLSEILKETGDVGEMELEIFKFNID